MLPVFFNHYHLPFTFVLGTVLELDHATPDSRVVSVVGLLVVIELAELSAYLGDAIIVVVLLRTKVRLSIVVFFVQMVDALIVVQHSNLLADQVASDDSLHLD